MGDFDITKTAYRDMHNKMTACHSPPNCANDGYQFHMTALRSSGQKGKLAQPYNTGIHNTYRLAGQQADIRQFHIEVDVSGATNDQVSARVYHHFNKQKVVQSRAAMAHGTSFTLPADNRMPRDLRFTRQSGGCADFFFNYGNTNIDWFRSFHFKSQDTGWKPYGRFGKGDGRYCITQSIPDPDPNRRGKFGTRLTCSFPAW
ncbi:hypothetical protein CBER1_10615 [Cercospora berteroae]|uniref:Uncharacterized protein n=1 Tax=Cercospora berteroae TaxID=357750 RepID=A0A2S6CJ41_9PEZI|nr:hypothetical protein CBER1_10615 [Cercospora berteroae]